MHMSSSGIFQGQCGLVGGCQGGNEKMQCHVVGGEDSKVHELVFF